MVGSSNRKEGKCCSASLTETSFQLPHGKDMGCVY